MNDDINICSISLDGFKQNGFYQDNNNAFDLDKLSKINIFIGKNNSGKSRLIRYIFQNQTTSAEHKIYPLNKVKELILKEYKDSIIKNHPDSNPYQALFESLSTLTKELNTIESYNSKFINLFNNGYYPPPNKNTNAIITTIQAEIKKSWTPCIENITKSNEYLSIVNLFNVLQDKTTRTYIPILRGMRSLTESIELYKIRTKNDYSLSINNSRKIFTGLEIYQELQHKLLGKPLGRTQVKDYEDFLSKNFFNNEIITLIPSLESQCVEIKIGEADQFPIYHLGDGLQTIIIVTFPIFMADESTLFFIEEPDLAMHPSMQRALIQIMLEQSQHQYFLTTHSNHFLDMALESDDISIFQVQKETNNNQESKFKITYANNLLKSIYQDLGIKNSSVLLANCTIWVEGITDKLYLKAYMKKYLQHLEKTEPKKYDTYKNFKEDLHYIFAEYQGSNIVHWNFGSDELENTKTNVEALCGTALLIADGDIKDKGSRVTDLTQIMGERFILLDAKEIENYIPIEIVKMTVKNMWNGFNDDKIDYILDESQIDSLKYFKSEGIGNYLESLIQPPTDIKKRIFFAEKSGTIKNKVKFCEIACSIMQSNTEWQLTPQLTELCEKIFKHIKANNPQ